VKKIPIQTKFKEKSTENFAGKNDRHIGRRGQGKRFQNFIEFLCLNRLPRAIRTICQTRVTKFETFFFELEAFVCPLKLNQNETKKIKEQN